MKGYSHSPKLPDWSRIIRCSWGNSLIPLQRCSQHIIQSPQPTGLCFECCQCLAIEVSEQTTVTDTYDDWEKENFSLQNVGCYLNAFGGINKVSTTLVCSVFQLVTKSLILCHVITHWQISSCPSFKKFKLRQWLWSVTLQYCKKIETSSFIIWCFL